MGRNADWQSGNHGAFLYYYYDCVRAFFQTVYVYGNSTYTSLNCCRRTLTAHRNIIYQILCFRLYGRRHNYPCMHNFLHVCCNAAAVSMVWSYLGELIFNMLVLVGMIKLSDRVVKEMMGL